MPRYPRYRELLFDLANAFWLEMMQQEDPETRGRIENGLSKRVKVFIDMAWDADAYDKLKKDEDIRWRTAMAMFFELQPPDFMEMNEEERSKFFRENREKLNQASERIRQKIRYSDP